VSQEQFHQSARSLDANDSTVLSSTHERKNYSCIVGGFGKKDGNTNFIKPLTEPSTMFPLSPGLVLHSMSDKSHSPQFTCRRGIASRESFTSPQSARFAP
jgi:hypothetical protein